MFYIAGICIVAIAAVLFGVAGLAGGLIWLVLVGVILGVLFIGRGRETRVARTRTEPTGTPRSARGGAETANERVGQA